MTETRGLRVVFRVAAGPRLGFGHLMRARALARALGVQPVVSLRGGAATRRAVRRMGCSLLPPSADAWARVDLLVVDDPSPIEAALWVQRAHRHGVLAVGVQDAGAADCGADLVVDGGLCGKRARSIRRLVGSRYCLLHRQGVTPRRARGRNNRRVLIALGGGGHVRHLARRLASAVALRCPTADILVAPGFVTTPPPRLRHGRWIEGPQALAAELRQARVAIVAGGLTLCEACALGIPMVGVAVVAAQRRAIEACAAAKAMVDAGGPEVDPGTSLRVADGVARLLESSALRARISTRARLLVDGRGAQRVARRIASLVKNGRTTRV